MFLPEHQQYLKLMNKSSGNFRSAFFTILLAVFTLSMITGCRSTRSVIKEPIKEYGADYLFEKLKENEFQYNWLSAKYNLDLLLDKKKTSFNGQLRMRKDSAIWISLSPALGIEMARILISEDTIKFINRLNKTYFIGDYEKINEMLGTNIDFDIIQSLLIGNDLTYYENGKFRASYDSKEYHLVTAGRAKLKKYVRNKEDEERVYIQNIYLNPESFKITSMKVKEIKKESIKLEALYSKFDKIGEQLFPNYVVYDISANSPILAELKYSKVSLDEKQRFPFKITSKYAPMQ